MMSNLKYLVLIFALYSHFSNAQTYSNPHYSWDHYWEDGDAKVLLFNGGLGAISGGIGWFSFSDFGGTNFNFSQTSTLGTQDIKIVEDDWGALVYGDTLWGLTALWNESDELCISVTTGFGNGKCTTATGSHAARGTIFINLYYVSGATANQKQWLLTHELSHVIGLAHTDPQNSYSVMRSKFSYGTIFELEPNLVSEIDWAY